MVEARSVRLSICISTFNRASFILETLESIVVGLSTECEIVIVDGSSNDGTALVVSEHFRNNPAVRYIRQPTNGGIDRDFDRAVELSRGEYCWLFSDDDLFKPGAVQTVLEAICGDYSLILVNAEHCNFKMSEVRIPNYFGRTSRVVYRGDEMDRLFADLGTCLVCICCVVIRRSIWLGRDRSRYFGTRFIHVGIIFQHPLPGSTLVISESLMKLRLGNEQTWVSELFQTVYVNWPALIWSLPLSEPTKRAFCPTPEPWKKLKYLLALRATGEYSEVEYRRCIRPQSQHAMLLIIAIAIAHLPRNAAGFLYALYAELCGVRRCPYEALSSMFPAARKQLLPTWKQEQKP